MPVGVTASPPSPVSFRQEGMLLPIFRIASITSSGGIRLKIPAIARSDAVSALTAPITFLLMHGTSTRPATGSQASPSRLFNASAAAWMICTASPPRSQVTAPAAMADAEPISA